MLRSLFTVSGFTLLSRILGLLRDIVVGGTLGTGASADAWFAAFRFPNAFRRIFGEGAFNSAFVPLYSRKLEEDGEAAADTFARRTFALLAVVLAVISVIAFIFMRPITQVITMGYEGDKLDLTVALSRITVGYLFFICLVAAVSAVLNSRRSFAAPAFAYVVLNIVFLVALCFVAPKVDRPVFVMAWSVLVAGVLQLLVVVVAALRAGVNLRPASPMPNSEMGRLAVLMGPGVLSAGIQQVNLFIGQTVASFKDGAVSFIYFADRINQLPLGLIGIAAGVVILTEFTRLLRGGDEEGARAALSQGMMLSLLLVVPAAVAMAVIPVPLMTGIFRGGAFTAEAAVEAGRTLAAFSLGAPAYIITRVLQPGYFGREDTKTPMRFTIVSAVVNIALCGVALFLLGRDGDLHIGCALATSAAGWVNALLLMWGLRKDGILRLAPGFLTKCFRILLAGMAMGAAVWFFAGWMEPWIDHSSRLVRLFSLVGLVGAGAAIYAVAILLFRATSVGELRGVLKRSS